MLPLSFDLFESSKLFHTKYYSKKLTASQRREYEYFRLTEVIHIIYTATCPLSTTLWKM